MKKLLAVLLAMAMMLALVACGGNNAANDKADDTAANNSAAKDDTAANDTAKDDAADEEVKFDKPIKVVVPYDAGGGVYNATIIVAGFAQEYLGTTIDVVCMAGAGGQEGIECV